jgi:hypothetical protein
MRDNSEDPIEQELRTLRTRLEQLELAFSAGRQAQEEQGARTAAVVGGFKKGDRVHIKNKLKKPAAWPKNNAWNQCLAQKATVTHTYREQVHFVTDNGVKTWRAENNLESLNDSTA